MAKNSKVVGMDHDKELLIQRLLAVDATEDANEVFEIIPIVGIGGSGKTTLATLVFKDRRISRHFSPRFWISASHDFSISGIESKIHGKALEAYSGDTSRPLNWLNGMRYLLVLDDVWEQEDLIDWISFKYTEFWGRLKRFLQCGHRGSKILVTTCSKKIASSVSKAPSHYVTRLNEDDSLKLLTKFAFPRGHEHAYPNLLDIGRNIVKKCHGNPSIIVTLGSLLKNRLNECFWEYVRVTDIWRLPREEFNVLASLKKHYDRLSFTLEHCFSYCALFPKGYRFDMKMMTLLWSAEGFLAPGNLATADYVIEELLSFSFFHDEERSSFGDVATFKIPDIFYDLAQLVAGNACSEKDVEDGYTFKRIKRISFLCSSTVEAKFWTEPGGALLRTILRHGSYGYPLTNYRLFDLHRLVVLDLRNCGIQHVPKLINRLIFLTYFDLSMNRDITELPETIYQLNDLQTLKLLGCENLRNLSKELQTMPGLICLETSSETNTPCWISSSISLHWLPNLVLGQETYNSRLSVLGALKALKGELHIFNLEYATLEEAKIASLKSKKLQELELGWRIKVAPQLILGNETAKGEDYSLLEALQPDKYLEKLSIRGYAGIQFSKWMMTLPSSFPSLVELSLIKCVNCITLPSIAELTSLKVLVLKSLISLEYVQEDIGQALVDECLFFPNLQCLSLNRLPRLVGWSAKDPHLRRQSLINGCVSTPFPCLAKLTIKHCPGLFKLHMGQVLQQLKFKASRATLLQSLMVSSCSINDCSKPCSSSILSYQQAPLISLEINLCADLESLPDCKVVNLSSLKSLSIVNCQRLESLSIWLHQLPILETLKVQWCPNVKLFEQENDDVSLGKLRSLTLSGLPCLENLSKGFQNAVNLQDLCIEYCKNLKCLSLEGFTSIHCIEVSCCHALTNLSTGMKYLNLSSLKKLKIKNCPNLVTSMERVNDLHRLESLKICGMVKLPSITHVLQRASALKVMCVVDCPDMGAFPGWLSILKSLTELRIYECPNLTSLPKEIERLTSLQKLSIEKCPNLLKGGLRKDGEDWKKIQHVKTLCFREAVNDAQDRMNNQNHSTLCFFIV